ncbi:MAG TPA: hypothetical protein VE871_07675 [Longimicrobium sp.]|nr:hypothetical protein [Longimicrobium sp.]
MHLVQILLPLRDNDDNPFPREMMDAVRHDLTERFGGVTAHLRAPAAGAWKDDDGDVAQDDVVIVEAVADDLDRAWWADYRRRLESRFRQDDILIRATEIERL